jgi:hypothetical protein
MSLEFLPPIETEKQRSAWFADRAKPGMTFEQIVRLMTKPSICFRPRKKNASGKPKA